MPGISRPDGSDSGGRLDAVVAVLLAAVGVFLLEVGPAVEVTVSEALRSTVLRPFLEAQAWVGQRAALEERLGELVDDNVQLQSRLLRRRGLEEENRQLRELAGLSETGTEGELVPARLLPAEPRMGVTSRFLLPVGRARGLRTPAGVLTADGVVGVVRAVTGERAVGDFWTHPDFRISVRVRDREITGIVRADQGDGLRPVMLFAGAPYQEEVPRGSVLVTSGAGGVFPPGVPVGTVQAQASAEAGWARSYRVRPSVRPEEVSVVLVWIVPTSVLDDLSPGSGGG